MIKLVILLVTATLCVLSVTQELIVFIILPDGPIQGKSYITPNNKTYYGFRGIPYATPPTGNLRFEAPQPPQPWDDVWDVTEDSKACISINHFSAPDSESEDCLYINVYTPALSPEVTLPVMFWIHGGGFTQGSSAKWMYGPDFLIEEDVVIVSFNYRLGPLGFLSTGDTVIRGNAGLKDQNLALNWTRENIESFGGDPNKITIFGQSAGAGSVGLHLVSKKSAGLFRAAIVESGSALTSYTIDLDPKSYAFSLADAIPGGNYGNDTQKLKEFLSEQTIDVIINATISLPSNKQAYPNIEVDEEDAFLTESPYELLESGKFNHVPTVIGICAEESLTFLQDLETAQSIAQSFDTVPSKLIPSSLRPNSSDEVSVIETIKNIYLKDLKLFSEDMVALAEYYSDTTITRAAIKQAELSSNYVPVYLYQFAYYGRVLTPAFIDGAEKAAHSAELPFLFHITGFEDTDADNLVTQNIMVKLWTNFVKFLDPTPDKSELLNNVTWTTMSPADQPFLNINRTLELKFNLREKTYPGWNKIFETYGKKPFITY